MRQSANRLLARGAAGGFVSLVTLALCSPATVQAGCEPTHLMRLGGSQTQFALLAQAGALADSESNLPAPEVPCSGPACKQGTPRPFSTIPSLTRLEMEEWALPVLRWSSGDLDSFDRPAMTVSVDGIDAACSIFHPPRSSSLRSTF